MTSLSKATAGSRQKTTRQAGDSAGSAATPEVSLEVFPAKDDAGLAALQALARRLAPFGPSFISVTYGAGGSNRERTLATIRALQQACDVPVAAHLTVVDASREDTLRAAETFIEHNNVNHIVALRGDPPGGDGPYQPHPQGFANAAELVAALRRRWPEITISVAAYPEVHPDSPSREADLANLKAKFEAGANEALTQFFFDNDLFFDFLEAARQAGVDGSIAPGIMLMPNFFQVKNFASRCKTSVPEWLEARFAGLKGRKDDDARAMQRLLATAFATEQVLDLVSRGVKHVHLYTMNRPEQAEAVMRALGRAPAANDCA